MGGNREIEIKVQIEDSKGLLAFLKRKGTYLGEERQIDEYYSPRHRDFTRERPTREWLRLRKEGDKSSINYKNWHYDKDGRSYFCDEYESGVDNAERLEKIFSALDIKPVVIVDKIRKKWLADSYEIAIDRVKNLGDFVEVEYKGKAKKEPRIISREMVAWLRQFKPGKICRNLVGYPFQLLFPKEVKVEEV